MPSSEALLFGIVSFVSTLALARTLIDFIPFLSSQSTHGEEPDAPLLTLFTVDASLMVLFILQHSCLASSRFKSWMEDWGVQWITRSVFVFSTCVVLQCLMGLWQPINNYYFWILDLDDCPSLKLFFTLIHCLLWFVLLLEVKALEPLTFIGVKQVYYYEYWMGNYPPEKYLPVKLQRLLEHMPHAGASCFILILWLHPYMTMDRAILATVLTSYLCSSMGVTESDYVYIKQYSVKKCVKNVRYSN